jgi:hypothetical protein
MSEELVSECRKGYLVKIPCNWEKDGYCGIDARPCS